MNQDLLALLVFGVALGVVATAGLLAGLRLALAGLGLRRLSRSAARWLVVALAPSLISAALVAYGALVEVNQLEVHREVVESPHLPPGERVRFVLLSDLHVDRETPVLDALPTVVRELSADLVVFAGDTLNSPDGLPIFRRTLGRLEARDGRYAVRGNHDAWFWSKLDLFGEGVATELPPEPLVAHGGRVVMCGVNYNYEHPLKGCLTRARAEHPDALVVAVLHVPDMIEDVAPLGPDLYLAGHTHGGQVRLPFHGAVMTRSRFGKKYEMGRYQVGDTVLYVNRGIGMEPWPAPRVRFLCKPEVTVIDVVGRAG